ncbi:superinfection exclusion B family protein [Enterococcus hirae]|nr:superinfection exclusion B family protein [Enterococcus hirae]
MINVDKIIDFLNNPLNKGILWSLGIVSAILLGLNVFLTSEQLHLLYIDSFLNKYGWLLPFIFLFSTVFLIVGFISGKVKKRKEKEEQSALEKIQNELLSDEQALVYLKELWNNHPNPTKLPAYNQKVKLLYQYGLISRTADQIPIYDPEQLANPYFPYILQPYAEKKMRELNEKKS